MEIAFESRELRTTCENDTQAKGELGATVAEALKHRLADLRAASSPKDLVAGRPRIMPDGERMALDVGETHHIVFKSNHPDHPVTETNEVDWSRVSRIRILGIKRNDC